MSQYSHLTADLSNPNSSTTKIARLIGRDLQVLDVGCAHGYLAEVLRAQGCRVTGVEIDEGDAARARAHCEQVVVRNVEEPGWTDELQERRFDAVVFSDVLEHLRDPGRVLREVVALLEPLRGFVVASIPNVAHASVRLELLLGSFRYEPIGILDATHLHFYTREGVHELFASSGLSIVSWDCTTNEIADHVIAAHLERAGLAYTPELRERFAEFDAMAFQFIVAARPTPSDGASPAAPPAKPLQVMEELVRDHSRLEVENQELWADKKALWTAKEALAAEKHALAAEKHALAAENSRLRTPPEALAEPRDGGLRILQAIHQFLPRHAAGSEIYCSDLSFALARRGHAVRVLSGAPFREDAGTSVQWQGENGIVVDRIPASRGYRRFGIAGGFLDRFDNPDARLAIRWTLDRMRPDVVHIQHLLYLSAELIPECRTRGIPVVVTLHDYWFLCHRIRLKRLNGALCSGPARGWNCSQCLNAPALMRSRLNPMAVAANLYRYAYLIRQLRKADRILAPSRFLRDVFARNGIPAERITPIEFGMPPVSFDQFASAEPRGRNQPLRAGFLGSLLPDKGLHVLIDAFNMLPAGAAELHVFGGAFDPPYHEELLRRARHPGIRWRGELPHADRWRALGEIDVLVVPSVWYENSPLTIHEARLAKVPVVASAIGGIPELVQHGVTGATFPAGDAAALAACLQAIIADRSRLDAWRRAIPAPKTLDTHADEIEALYRELRDARTGGTQPAAPATPPPRPN